MASIKLKGDTSGEVTISAPSVAGTTTLELPATSSTLATQNSLGVRNLIINGDMRIAQRGTSVTGITSGAHYTTDRFQIYNQSSATYTLEQSTDSPTNFTNSTKVTVTTAGSSATASWTSFLQTKLEGQDIALLNAGTSDARTATLSFWVKSSLTGDMPIQLKNNADRQYLTSYTISTANTWEHKTITVTFPTDGTWTTDNSRGLQLSWGLGSGSTYTNGTVDSWQSGVAYYFVTGNTAVGETSGATFYITGVQLEVGTEATPFEHRPYDMELQRCQRYYYKLAEGNSVFMTNGCAFNATTVTTGVNFPTEMRSTPALDATSGTDYYRMRATGTNFSGSGLSLMGNTLNGKSACFSYSTSGMSSGIGGLVITNNSNAYVAFTAEL